MTKEEFINKLESDENLFKAFEADPLKVIQENDVELSEEDLANIAGGRVKLPFGPPKGPKPPWEEFIK